jgi:rhodanese-related sulfurtransferase
MGQKMRYLRLTLVILSAVFLAACGATAAPLPTVSESAPPPAGTYGHLSPAQLNAMLAQKRFTFIDVHTPYEGEIASTDAFIPYDEIDQKRDGLPGDKNAMIVLYCRSGRMSNIAANTLIKLGYTNVWSLDGGMAAWESAGNKLLTK